MSPVECERCGGRGYLVRREGGRNPCSGCQHRCVRYTATGTACACGWDSGAVSTWDDSAKAYVDHYTTSTTAMSARVSGDPRVDIGAVGSNHPSASVLAPAVSSKAAGPDGAAESEREHFGADRVGPPTSAAPTTHKEKSRAACDDPTPNDNA